MTRYSISLLKQLVSREDDQRAPVLVGRTTT